MRTASTSPISDHRLARLMRWAWLWLAWFAAAFVLEFGPGAPVAWRRHAAGQLDRVARMVGRLILIHAVARVTPPRRANHRHGRLKQRGFMRAMIGSTLRRKMRARDGRPSLARLGAILTVVRDAKRHIAKLARRLRRGLSRLRVVPPTRDRCLIGGVAHTCAVIGADTS